MQYAVQQGATEEDMLKNLEEHESYCLSIEPEVEALEGVHQVHLLNLLKTMIYLS